MGNSDKTNIVAFVAHALSKLGVKNTSSVLIAVSGGVDSMSLAYILNELRMQGHIKGLGIIHINHSLRGKQSDKDEKLVRQFAKKKKLPVYTFVVGTKAFAKQNKIGIEEAARILRYEKITEIAASKKYNFVATAHTANDQTETVLMNIVRGAGLNGLQGIPESRKLSDISTIIRPVLGVAKTDLKKFAKKNNIPFREDKSNDSLDFKRNRVRHLVLPALEKSFKGRDVFSGFSKMTQNIASIAEYINDEVLALRQITFVNRSAFFIDRKILFFERAALLTAPDFLIRELILQEASALSGKLISIDNVHTLLMQSFLSYPSNKSFPLTKNILISHDGKCISLEKIDPAPQDNHHLIIGKKVKTPIGTLSLKKVKTWKKPKDGNSAYFKYSDIGSRKLLVRFWKAGDKIKPFGMKGKSRLVSDILNEAGIKSERLKYFVPLVVFEDEPSFILWIPGIRSAEFGRLSAKSETALELSRII